MQSNPRRIILFKLIFEIKIGLYYKYTDNKKMLKTYNYIDLFAGTGAFSLAFQKHKNFSCVFANDMCKSSKKIYEMNNPSHRFTHMNLNEIKTSNIPSHSILCAGFPCQPFSIAGEKKGFNDERSNVFWKIVSILEMHKPNIIILENVKNLKSHDKGRTFKIIEQKLRETGYHIKTAILDTNKITTIPHHRERIYIVGFRDIKMYDAFHFDFEIKKQKAISEMLQNDVPSKYYYSERFKVFDVVKKGVTKHISKNVLYQYRRYYIRENKSNCCPTLTANMGSGGHNVPLLKDNIGIRKLTPRECFNLQGFPSNYKLPNMCDGALYKLAGNAVSVPVVQLIIDKLKKIL